MARKQLGAITSGSTDTVSVGGSQTLSGKRVTIRVTTINAPGATPTIATDAYDQVNLTSIGTAITSITMSGTPTDGQKILLRFKDSGTAQTITWGTSFVSSGTATLLATTIVSKTHMVGLIYDSAVSKWVCAAVDATGY